MHKRLFLLPQVVITLGLIIATTPVVASVVVPIMLVYFAIQRVFVATSRQVMRLESVSKSPIFSHFSETIAGKKITQSVHAALCTLKCIDKSQLTFYTCTYYFLSW